jgi:putative DNA primase/helicase
MMPSADFVAMLGALRAHRIGPRAWAAKCPAHDDHSPSLTIYEGKQGQPLFVCGRCEWRDVRNALRERGLAIVAKKKRGEKDRVPSPQVAVPPAPDYSKAALKLWEQTQSGKGTLVEKYLRHRGLSPALDLLPDLLSRVLRFHGACPRGRGKDAVHLPAMLALMRNAVTDAPVAIHRTFLTPEGVKDGKPMMLGPSEGAAVKLYAHRSVFMHGPLSLLHVCEGIETGLAAATFGYVPIWALGSAGAIERLPVIAGIGELIVCADNDKRGLYAAQNAMGRWQAAALVDTAHPHLPGADFADLVMP